jgi:hypothetical protein
MLRVEGEAEVVGCSGKLRRWRLNAASSQFGTRAFSRTANFSGQPMKRSASRRDVLGD